MKRFLNRKVIISVMVFLYGGQAITAQSAVVFDRTRVIYNATSKSISVNVNNDNTQLPYLAQVWLEDEKQKKITEGSLVVTPPIQRLEPSSKSMVRITATPDIKSLPEDRESVFYLNLREIPPRSDKPNVLQIALQTKIKLFYRPESIIVKRGSAPWQEQLILNIIEDGYQIENPTPYYITVIGIAGSKKQSEVGEFDSFMISPKSTLNIKSKTYATPYLTYINDYGGRPTLKFSCYSKRCKVKSN